MIFCGGDEVHLFRLLCKSYLNLRQVKYVYGNIFIVGQPIFQNTFTNI